ncbi:unnamed protein product [Euphydryas editha]|uniref:Uncharacterized protein n=1 Tax=Euphydryas editha TaxID=104508 RepID=A0AAU9TXH7_EUPED|nr:unnamed protein product [Euphydryas editha]
MSRFCFICNKPLSKSEIVTVNLGMKTLINASIERGDEFTDYLKDQKSVKVHVECRKNYTRKSTIAAVKRKREEKQASASKVSPPRARTRLSESAFCLKSCCLFCGDQLNEEYEKKRAKKYRRRICKVSTLTFKESVLKVAQSRSDDTAKIVVARIGFEHDLVAAETRYHNDCYISFLKPTNGGKVGRPLDEALNLAMEKIFTYIENSNDDQFTLEELKNVCKNSNIDNRTIKRRLKLNYGDKVIITEKPGKSTLICLIDNHRDTLNQSRSEKQKSNGQEERFKILEDAAPIVGEDIQSVIINNSHYTPPGRIFENINGHILESQVYFIIKKTINGSI